MSQTFDPTSENENVHALSAAKLRALGLLCLLGLLLIALAPWGCGGPTPTPDTKESEPKKDTASVPDDKSAEEPLKDGKQPPVDVGQRLKAGESRAGLIASESAFIGGPNAQEKIGDVKIYNSKVAFTIAGLRRTNGYLSQGGRIVAADVIRPKGVPGESLFQEFSLAWQHRMMKPEKIEIVNDGRDGKDAVVRIEGKDHELPLLLAYIKAASSTFANDTRVLNFRVVYEFRLAPDAEVLTIRTTITNNAKEYHAINFAEVGFFMGDGLNNFFPRRGFIDKNATGEWLYHGLAGKRVSYVVYPNEDEFFQLLLKFKTVLIGLQDSFDIDPGKSLTRTWHVAVGRDLAAAQAIYRRSRKGADKVGFGEVGGEVKTASGDALVGARIHIEQTKDDGSVDYVGVARSRDKGSYAIELPVGKYQLRVEWAGQRSAPVDVEIGRGATRQTALIAPSSGTLVLKAREGGKSVPVKLTALRVSPKIPSLPSHYGAAGYSGGAALIHYSHTGDASLQLAPGKYTIQVSRGFFYDVVVKEVEIAPGATVNIDATMKQVVALPQILSGDFHVHAKGSPDSQDTNELKVAAMAGEGLELAVSTDHEFVTDYQPVIEKMGLADRIRAVVGEEVTTFYGHFNTFPIPHKADEVNNGAFQWYLREAPAMFDFVAKQAPDSIIQVNHPRGIAAGSYFTYVNYDPETGKPRKRPEQWSWKFHAIELVNGNDFNNALKTTMPDWYSMLNRGIKVTGMGNSDSHNALTSECGSPRNMLLIGVSEPAALTTKRLAETIKSQKVVVSGGAMIQLSASATGDASKAVGLGSMLSFSASKVFVHVKVEAATWVPLDTLEIIVNGKVVATKQIEVKDAVVRFDDKIEIDLPAGKDAWVIAMVKGKASLTMVAPGHKPFAFTNPIFLDANDNKRFDPPIEMRP